MSTQQTRSGGGGGGGGGGRTHNKKSNSANFGGGGGGGGGNSNNDAGANHATHAATVNKKTDANKTEKPEKAQPKATTEQLRIAQITNSNTTEDPQINEKVTLLLTMTQRSEEEVCCALNECDYDLEAAANFLIEILPQGAFAKYEKKRKNKVASAVADGAGGDGDWADGNANADRREKSRNRSANRGGRGGTDSRGWRGRESRENERNMRESRGGDRGEDRANDNYRGQRNGGGRSGPGGGAGGGGGGRDGRDGGGGRDGGRGGGFMSRPGRGGGRMGGRSSGPRGERGFGVRSNNPNNEDHHEVELWDNTIAQNAEKQQQQQAHDDAWGDWNNEEYEGSLKDSKVFTTSNLNTQTAASVVSGGGVGVGATVTSSELSAPPGLEHHHHHLGGSNVAQAAHLSALDDSNSSTAPATVVSSATTPMMQYSAAVSNPPPQLQSVVSTPSSSQVASVNPLPLPYAGNVAAVTADTFSSAASAAATLVQQAQLQQQQTPLKPSATLSAEQSQYFNSLTSQGASPTAAAAAVAAATAQQPSMSGVYGSQSSSGVQSASSQYPSTYANVFASAPGSVSVSNSAVGGTQTTNEQSQQPQVRRARVKLPPPSKIPASAVEMPGDNAVNNIGYLDVQFGAMDFGTDDSFDTLPEKFNSGVSIDAQQQQHQQQQDDYQSKTQQQQAALSAGLQNAQILQGDALSAAGYAARATAQQQSGNALDQLTKNDPYGHGQAVSGNNGPTAYQNAYQSSAASKVANSGYPTSASVQGYNSSSYANVQSSVANSYQPSSYGSYQPNAVNSINYQQQQTGAGAQNATGSVAGGVAATQNIPISGSGGQNSSSANASSAYLTSGYSTPQSAYQSSQSVYGSTGLSNSSGFAGSASNSSSQYVNFSASAKLKDAATGGASAHYDSVSTSSGVSSNSASTGNGAAGAGSGAPGANQAVVSNTNNNVSGSSSASSVTAGGNNNSSNVGVVSSQGVNSMAGVSSGVGVGGVVSGVSASSVGSGGVGVGGNNAVSVAAVAQTAAGTAAVLASLTNKNSNSSSNSSGSGGNGSGGATTGSGAGGAGGSSSTGAGGAGSGGGSGGNSSGGLVPTNIQMVSQYIQTGLPYYQQPVYSYEELQMMQQRVPHVQGYYDLNYTPTSLNAGRDNLGSVAYSTMTDGRFARTDNNSSPVSNVSSTMSQQAGSSAPMLNVPYAYFYGGNVMPGGFQYGTPAIYPQQIPAANTASGGQFPKPSYSAGYGSTSYDTLSQTTQDYSKGGYSSSVNQQSKTQTVSNQPQAGTGSDLTSSMYGKGHVALNKVNSYEKQSFHSGTPPPFNMANTQTAGGTSAQPYGMYLPMPAAGHHNMIHQPIHQDSNSAGQRQQSSSQSKSAGKPSYPTSYWTGQN